jgi:hypothetical protein
MRPLCKVCGKNFSAINGYHNNKVYYRTKCNVCIRKQKKLPAAVPRWKTAGYKKKATCDKCGFKSRYSGQLVVHHVDGDLNNCTLRNLKTICLNCTIDVVKRDLPWRPGDIEPDH